MKRTPLALPAQWHGAWLTGSKIKWVRVAEKAVERPTFDISGPPFQLPAFCEERVTCLLQSSVLIKYSTVLCYPDRFGVVCNFGQDCDILSFP